MYKINIFPIEETIILAAFVQKMEKVLDNFGNFPKQKKFTTVLTN